MVTRAAQILESLNESAQDQIAKVLKSKVGLNDKEVTYFLEGGAPNKALESSIMDKCKKIDPDFGFNGNYTDDKAFWKALGVAENLYDKMVDELEG